MARDRGELNREDYARYKDDVKKEGKPFFPFALFRWGGYDMALAVALALVAACSTATLTALALPWLLHRLGGDPAFGSGPLATVVQDLLSIMIYLVICRAVVS